MASFPFRWIGISGQSEDFGHNRVRFSTPQSFIY